MAQTENFEISKSTHHPLSNPGNNPDVKNMLPQLSKLSEAFVVIPKYNPTKTNRKSNTRCFIHCASRFLYKLLPIFTLRCSRHFAVNFMNRISGRKCQKETPKAHREENRYDIEDEVVSSAELFH